MVVTRTMLKNGTNKRFEHISIPTKGNEKKQIKKIKNQYNLNSLDRKSTRLNSSHSQISYAVFCLKKKKQSPPSSRTLHATVSIYGRRAVHAAPVLSSPPRLMQISFAFTQ